MNYKQIHAALKAEGLTWEDTGQAIGVAYQHVMNVCSRRTESPRVAKAVSVLIHKEVSEVFPDVPRYSQDPELSRQARIDKAKARLAEAGLAEAV